jgi:hypothetical protein
MSGGISNYSKDRALDLILPQGTTYYVGLLTVLPSDDAGTGMVEATGSGYARKGRSTWLDDTTHDPIYYRGNASAHIFDVLSADLADIVGWAIWDAAVAGNLIAWGSLQDIGGNDITKTFSSGNQPRFLTGELKVGLD